MKDFFKEVEEVREVADKIDAKIQEVKKLQVAILNSPKVIDLEGKQGQVCQH